MQLKNYLDEERGRARDLSELMGISKSYLSQMASGDAPISPKRGVEIEEKTNGAVTRKEMFASDWQDIWPELKELPCDT